MNEILLRLQKKITLLGGSIAGMNDFALVSKEMDQGYRVYRLMQDGNIDTDLGQIVFDEFKLYKSYIAVSRLSGNCEDNRLYAKNSDLNIIRGLDIRKGALYEQEGVPIAILPISRNSVLICNIYGERHVLEDIETSDKNKDYATHKPYIIYHKRMEEYFILLNSYTNNTAKKDYLNLAFWSRDFKSFGVVLNNAREKLIY